MITWIIYIIVGFILFFVMYLAVMGINRGVKAKDANKLKKKLDSPKNITSELVKLKKLYDNGTIDKKEFNIAKKKLLG